MAITIYQDFRNEQPIYYLRIGAVQTKLFPHGVITGTSYDTKEDADYWRTQFEEALGLIENED